MNKKLLKSNSGNVSLNSNTIYGNACSNTAINGTSSNYTQGIITIDNTGTYTTTTTTMNIPNTLNNPYYMSTYDTTQEKTVEFVEFIFKILNIDLDFETFRLMGEDEKINFIRKHTINDIIK